VTPVLVIAGLIVLNGLFVAAEFAIVGANRMAVERRAREGSRLAGLVARVVGDAREQDRYIATAQLGITTASLALGMYGEHLLAEWLAHQLEVVALLEWVGVHAVASVLAVAFLTYLHVVLGEMVPKALALQAPVTTAITVAAPMRAIELVLYPLVVALNGIGNGVLALFGIDRTVGGEGQMRTTDEIGFIVAESRAGGLLAHEPARVIQELLEFGQRTAREVMVPRTGMNALPLGADVETVHALVRDDRHTRYPVHDGDPDRIVGVVHVKDLLDELPRRGTLDQELLRDIPFLPATDPLDRVLSVMRREKAHMAVVMDEHGGTAGIVTLEDLFEEVVGEIGDPSEEVPVRQDPDGTVRVAGTARLDELGEALGMVLDHPEVDTISGLVLATLGRPAAVGDRVEHAHVEIEVTAVRGRGVEEVRVIRATQPL
jgi:CBS domain containing-hemolysin-like protein